MAVTSENPINASLARRIDADIRELTSFFEKQQKAESDRKKVIASKRVNRRRTGKILRGA